jgi:sulfite exporter TauE/SafE
MTPDFLLLAGTAIAIAVTHTILGPDHTIPFIAISRARAWSMRRTMLVTFICGIGHVLSSVVIGLGGLYMGAKLFRLTNLESVRGTIAGWLLLGFGLAYLVWGLRHAYKARNSVEALNGKPLDKSITPWVLFIIFAFGPCEPLIPLLMFPAAQASMSAVWLISGIFGICTIGTMMGIVAAATKGLSVFSRASMTRYSHALAGGAVTLCAAGMVFFGL